MKKLIALLIFLVVFLPHHSEGSSSLLTNLQGYWKADESSGTAADSSGNGYTLTNNNVVTYTPAKINNGFTMDLASSQYMSRTSASSANLNYNATDFTINCWVKWDTLPSSNTLQNFMGKMESGNRQYSFNQFNNAGTEQLYAEVGIGGDTASAVSVNWTPSTGVFYMVTFRFTNSTSKGDFSVNGSAQGTQQSFTNQVASDDADFRIGSAFGGRFMNGQLDECGTWDRRLTDAEITTLYNGGSGLTYPFTQAAGFSFWQFGDF